jgi:hypothetical protein
MALKFNMNIDALVKSKIEKEKIAETNKLVEALKEATPVDTGRARDGWKVVDGNITNDVPYIDELNGGSSKQAPQYFIERTLLSHIGIEANGVIVTPSE